jgi:hypothetical protein
MTQQSGEISVSLQCFPENMKRHGHTRGQQGAQVRDMRWVFPPCGLQVLENMSSYFLLQKRILDTTIIQRMPNLGRPHQYPWEKIGDEVIMCGHDLFTFFEI